MKETIVLSNINSRELSRSLALHGKDFFNVRFVDSLSLAKEALLRSGTVIENKQISKLKSECIIFDILKNIDYFKNCNFEDSKNIYRSINYARLLCRNNEEEKIKEVFSTGNFDRKNKAILEVYNKYKNYLKDNNLIDPIGIINYSIENSQTIDADFIVLNETALEPLEEELLKKVSGGNFKKLSINELATKEEKKQSNISYDEAYGSVNEVEHIIGTIHKNKIKYGDCLIVLVDNSYTNQFMSYKDVYEIPMSFGMGYDLSLFNSFKLLSLIDKWNKKYNGLDGLNELIYAPEFNTNKLWTNINGENLSFVEKSEIVKIVGNLRLSTIKDDKINNYRNSLTSEKEKELYTYVEAIANEFCKGYSYLIKEYTNVEIGDIESKAINAICTYIDEYFENIKDGNLEDIINELSKRRINRELSKPNSIHITDLKGGLATIRKHIFICGLNAKVFPGLPSEDYLLLDEDLNRFNEPNVKDSAQKININKKLLLDVLHNANAFDSNIHLSYSGYSLSDLKKENASSMLFEIYKEEHGDTSTVKEFNEAIGQEHHYFDEELSPLTNVGRKYLEGITTKEVSDKADEQSSFLYTREISPSSAEIFFSCPKRFYLSKLLGIVEPDEDDPFVEIPANDEGELIHECMEDYGNNTNWTKEEFMENASKKFENFLNKRVPIHDKNISNIKNTYLQMAEYAYDSDPKNKVYASEIKLSYKDPITGLTFGGRVDRIEELENGKYQIVDYKTYRTYKNIDDDIDKCFQTVLYAYLLENSENKEVDNCQYRYVRLKGNVNCVYNDGMKSQLQDRLQKIREALDSGIFECKPGVKDDNCKYCKLSKICGKEKLSSNLNANEEGSDE